MGSGTWKSADFASYTTRTKGMSVDAFATADNLNAQSVYKARHLRPALDPHNVTRECRDSEEHPQTLPVILALDVTGSMGQASVKVAQKLNQIMTDLYADPNIKDIEFCVMGIGDISYDRAPIQISQFESDIRIAEQLDQMWFEAGGGGNSFESYTAAWYMGLNHCKLDCWNRGQKGIIITMGDELPNPYLPLTMGLHLNGKILQADVETADLLAQVKDKFDVYHISVDDTSSSYSWHQDRYDLDRNWSELLGKDNYKVANLDNLATIITDIIKSHVTTTAATTANAGLKTNDKSEVVWW